MKIKAAIRVVIIPKDIARLYLNWRALISIKFHEGGAW